MEKYQGFIYVSSKKKNIYIYVTCIYCKYLHILHNVPLYISSNELYLFCIIILFHVIKIVTIIESF